MTVAVVKFKDAKIGLVISCEASPGPVEVIIISGHRIQLQILPTEGGRQYSTWPKIWLDDDDFNDARYVRYKG